MQLFSRMSATRSLKMFLTPSWDAPYPWSVIKILLYCLECDPFEACRIWTVDSLSLEMVVDSSGDRGLIVLAHRSCNNVGFLDYPDDSMEHFDDLQCMHGALLET